MGVLSSLKKFLKDPLYVITKPKTFPLVNLIPDKLYLRLRYKAKLGRYPDLDNPKLFTEKMQWLKLYDRRPEYVHIVDKYEARKTIAEQCGEQYLIPLLGVWDRVEDIDFSKLPEQFVLKCTHDSGGVIVCSNKSALDIEAAKEKLKRRLKFNYFWYSREYPYKKVKPRIICEKYMVDESGTELKDYKIFCFSGEPKYIQLDYERFTGHKRNMYDTEWNFVPFSVNTYYPDMSRTFKKPDDLEEMFSISRKLSREYAFLRVDFYIIGGRIYIGELTLYPESGIGVIKPQEYDAALGELLDISRVH